MNRQDFSEGFFGKGLLLAVLIAFAFFMVIAVCSSFPAFGDFPERSWENFQTTSVGASYNDMAAVETGNRNVVGAVLWDYRGYDTLGEATVLFTAVCVVLAILRRNTKKNGRQK